MEADEFWRIIEASRAASDGSFDGRAQALAEELVKRPAEDIMSFYGAFRDAMDRAYTWDLWGAAYVLGGGCSDDGFTDFRSWLISRGRTAYEAALADPDSLEGVKFGPNGEEDCFFEEFRYVALSAYQSKTGEEMPELDREFPTEPSGEPWQEDDEELERRYPRLWSKHGSP